MWKRIGRVDRRLMQGTARLSTPAADLGLRELSRAADHGLLWFVLAALLGVRAGQTRRGAIRGLVGLGAASASVNLLGKSLFGRRRPAAALVPHARRAERRPVSSSFPSGHAASAAAFATGVALESPLAGLALVPLAGAVAYSRAHTGVHWPSDVAAGALVGVAAGLGTTHFSPVREDAPLDPPPAASAPQLDAGARLLFVVNRKAGDGTAVERVTSYWPEAHILEIADELEPEDKLESRLRAAIAAEGPKALGVAGGDGTVAAVAGMAAEAGLPLVVSAAGTLNHFTRDAGCGQPPTHATECGVGARIDLATVTVDGAVARRWIVNTASLGVYPQLVAERERREHRYGKWPAAALALAGVLSRASPLRLSIDGEPHTVWTLFVGNNVYLPSEFTPAYRPSMASGLLDIRVVLAEGRCSRLRFALAALTGSLHETKTYRRYCAETVQVASHEPVRLATDGEVGPPGRAFGFTSKHSALRIYRDSNTTSTRSIGSPR